MIFSIKISCQSTDAIKPTKQWRHSILTLPRGQMWLLGSPSPGGARGLGGVGEKALEAMKSLALFTIAASTLLLGPAQAQDIATLLKDTDRYRMSAENLQVDTQVTVFNTDGSSDKERRYTVFAQAERKSLVLMQSPVEKGQKVLMLGDDFWLMMRGTQRAMRITPMQKLLGDASTGDIATMNWAGDYTGQLVGEEPCQSESKAQCLHLSLKATRKGVTYQRIELWVGKTRHEPVRADLFVQSDKLAKQARFVMDKPHAPTMVNEMVLLDKLSNHKETRVRYLGRKERVVPQTWLNPMFLAKNPALE